MNADKHYQFNQDFAFYKGGWWGTHNFKFGYQLNHLVNVIDQNGNVPCAFLGRRWARRYLDLHVNRHVQLHTSSWQSGATAPASTAT